MQGEERLPREDRGERVDMGEVWLGVVGGVCSHQAKEMSRENREKETIIKSTKVLYTATEIVVHRTRSALRLTPTSVSFKRFSNVSSIAIRGD